MRSLLIAVNFWLSLLGSSVYSAFILQSRAPDELGYDCDDVFFPSNRVQKLINRARIASGAPDKNSKAYKQYLSTYNGPPFTRHYHIAPLHPTSDLYREGALTPFRVVFDENFRVISMIIQNDDGVKECKLREKTTLQHFKFDYTCREMFFPFQSLVDAVEEACPKLDKFATSAFPARLDKPYFAIFGKQRYIYPVFLNRAYIEGEDPGEYRVVMNNHCRLIGVIGYDSSEPYVCTRSGISGNPTAEMVKCTISD